MSEHLDDQALSAILDGEEPPSAHLHGCDDCRARSDQLQAAARLIGIAVPPTDPRRREAAIVVALAANHPARVRWRPPPGALAAAAVLLAIAALVPLLLTRGGGSDDTEKSTLADSNASRPFAADDRALGAGGSQEAMIAAPTMAGDLGTIDDNDLRTRVLDVLNAPPQASPDTPIACEDDVRTMDREAGRLVLFGQATVNKRAGFVLVFEVEDSDPIKLTAYVVAQDNCAQVLQFASFVAP